MTAKDIFLLGYVQNPESPRAGWLEYAISCSVEYCQWWLRRAFNVESEAAQRIS